MTLSLAGEQVAAYERDGYVVIEGFFAPDELAPVIAGIDAGTLSPWPIDMRAADGGASRFLMFTDVPDNPVGGLATAPRLVAAVRTLLGDDVYHWHSKVMLKGPGHPGEWEWHQDYGYWYYDGCPYPRMLSVMIALDPATRANGCLKVLAGSHRLGRLDHEPMGDQRGADPQRVAAVMTRHEERWLEVGAGSIILFHCTTLHSSEPNRSPHPRRALICSYNAMGNVPVTGPGHGQAVALGADEVFT